MLISPNYPKLTPMMAPKKMFNACTDARYSSTGTWLVDLTPRQMRATSAFMIVPTLNYPTPMMCYL